MKNLNDTIKELLEYAFTDESNSVSEAIEYVKAFSCDDVHILNLKENTLFIKSDSPLDYIYIQIKGITYVVKYTLDGRRIIAATFTGAQLFGLLEAINGAGTYRGTVITLSDSIMVRVSKERLLKAIYSDIGTASTIIKYLAEFSTHSIEAFENKAAISTYENLIIYLYNKALGKRLPYEIKDKKAFIADLLQIDKRTLYRYLNKLSAEGLISRSGQGIVVSESNFDSLKKLFSSIHNI